MFIAGVELGTHFCAMNNIPQPAIARLRPGEKLYHLATCAYYRPYTITIMVEKCAHRGMGGRAWSWPGYVIDRTPYGVYQHELGHHLDTIVTRQTKGDNPPLFSKHVWERSQEPPLTGYLGTDKEAATFYMEWFAEHFRLFVTNPDLCHQLRPRFFNTITNCGFKPVTNDDWDLVLLLNDAPSRIVEQARKKISQVK